MSDNQISNETQASQREHGSLGNTQLSVSEIIRMYLSQWRLFAVLTGLLLAIAVIVYAVKIPFIAGGTLLVNDSQNSSLQAFSSQYFGLSKSVQESKKGNSLLAKHLEYLKTREFQEDLYQEIILRGVSPKITLEEQKGFQYLKENYFSTDDDLKGKIRLFQKLAKWTKVSLDSEFEIKILVATESREMSLFLANTALQLGRESLKARELDEIQQVETFITKQKAEADKNLSTISQQLADYQNTDDNLLPLVSKDKMGDYVSELLVRLNELKLKMADNKKMINLLERGRENVRESRLYGVGGRIEALKIENRILVSKYEQLNSSISRMRQQIKKLPFAAQMADDLKKKSEVEFAKYRELSAALSRIEAQKLSVDARFDIQEKARWETSGPQVSLVTLLFIACLLSQVMGSIVVYFKFLWDPNIITVQASRNLAIFDGHSLDPRVIIENSKIKFSLKSFKPKEDEPALIEDAKSSEQGL